MEETNEETNEPDRIDREIVGQSCSIGNGEVRLTSGTESIERISEICLSIYEEARPDILRW